MCLSGVDFSCKAVIGQIILYLLQKVHSDIQPEQVWRSRWVGWGPACIAPTAGRWDEGAGRQEGCIWMRGLCLALVLFLLSILLCIKLTQGKPEPHCVCNQLRSRAPFPFIMSPHKTNPCLCCGWLARTRGNVLPSSQPRYKSMGRNHDYYPFFLLAALKSV